MAMALNTGGAAPTERGLHAQVLAAVGEDIVDGVYPIGSQGNQT